MHRIAAAVAEIALTADGEGMPKKRRRRNRTPQQGSPPAAQQARAQRRAVLADYQRWRTGIATYGTAGAAATGTATAGEAGSDPIPDSAGSGVIEDVGAEAELLEILLELKAEELHSPDPGMWSSQLITQLFLDILARRPLLTRPQIVMLKGTVLCYFDFVHETSRWHTCAGSIEVARWLVGSFIISLPELHDGERSLPAPAPELNGGDVGDGVAAGLLDPAAIHAVSEQLTENMGDLFEDVDWLSFAGRVPDARDDDAEDPGSVMAIALGALEQLEQLRTVLDRLETHLYLATAVR